MLSSCSLLLSTAEEVGADEEDDEGIDGGAVLFMQNPIAFPVPRDLRVPADLFERAGYEQILYGPAGKHRQ